MSYIEGKKIQLLELLEILSRSKFTKFQLEGNFIAATPNAPSVPTPARPSTTIPATPAAELMSGVHVSTTKTISQTAFLPRWYQSDQKYCINKKEPQQPCPEYQNMGYRTTIMLSDNFTIYFLHILGI